MSVITQMAAPVLAALSMGLLGGPHCIAMCGAACAGIARASGNDQQALWRFQIGRLLGYSLLGAVVAGSVQAMGWLGENTSVVRPLWASFHVLAALMGLSLMVLGRQPYWMDGMAQRLWRWSKPKLQGRSANTPMLIGMLWALMPCGLLYSALLVAALSNNAVQGSVTMAAFAVGSGLSMSLGAWWLLRVRANPSGHWAIRSAGLALLAMSAWAIYMGITAPTGLWC